MAPGKSLHPGRGGRIEGYVHESRGTPTEVDDGFTWLAARRCSRMRTRITGSGLLMVVAALPVTGTAQKKGRYILGTNGLNAGIQPAVAAIGPQATFIAPKWNLNVFFRYETEFAASARGRHDLDLRGSDHLPRNQMMNPPKCRYRKSANIPPAYLTALGSLASASAARTQCPGVDRVQPDRGD